MNNIKIYENSGIQYPNLNNYATDEANMHGQYVQIIIEAW
jgi:hypothetical protein